MLGITPLGIVFEEGHAGDNCKERTQLAVLSGLAQEGSRDAELEDLSYYGVYMQGGENPHGHPFKRRQADCLKENTIIPFILSGAAMDIELETHMGQCEDSFRCTSCQWHHDQ